MLTQIDFTTLPAPNVIERLDFETILAAMVDDFQARYPGWTGDVEADPAAKILEAGAYGRLLDRARINDAAKALLLPYASGVDLDQVAANQGIVRLTGEADAPLRERVRLSFYRPAAGSAEAYRLIAFSASAAVRDVQVYLDSSGVVHIAVLAYEQVALLDATADEARQGALAFPDIAAALDTTSAVIISRSDGAILSAIHTSLDAGDRVPLTDVWQVHPPTVTEYDLDAEFVLNPLADASTVLLTATNDLDAFLDIHTKVGHDHTLSGITDALYVSGVHSLTIASPGADVIIGDGGLALCANRTLGVSSGRSL